MSGIDAKVVDRQYRILRQHGSDEHGEYGKGPAGH